MKGDDPRFLGNSRFAGFKEAWAIPGDREKTLRKNKKNFKERVVHAVPETFPIVIFSLKTIF
jgi:hypothetical protein